MPRQTFLEHGATAWGLSLHLISGQTTIIALLFILHALSLLCLFLGYHTSTAALISWCLEMSLQNRNAMVLQGGDVVCRGVVVVTGNDSGGSPVDGWLSESV